MHIVGETTISVRHCLLALPGVQKDALRRIISHPQALAQTDNYIRRLPRVVKEAVDDTAGAAKLIAEQGWTYEPITLRACVCVYMRVQLLFLGFGLLRSHV